MALFCRFDLSFVFHMLIHKFNIIYKYINNCAFMDRSIYMYVFIVKTVHSFDIIDFNFIIMMIILSTTISIMFEVKYEDIYNNLDIKFILFQIISINVFLFI